MDKTLHIGVCRLTGKIYDKNRLNLGYMNTEGKIDINFSSMNDIPKDSKTYFVNVDGRVNWRDGLKPEISEESYEYRQKSIKETFGKRPIVDKMNDWMHDQANTKLTFEIQKELEDCVIDLI
jgi:hypothetical protein